MAKSKIEWTEKTWNPITGCSKVSPGCKHCYAETMAKRLQAMHQPNYANGFQLTLQPHMLELPLKWQKPQIIFVNSMSDLFHKDVPFEYIANVFDVMNRANWHTYQILTKRADRLLDFDVMNRANWHTYQILTKRADRLLELHAKLNWQPHIWMGVSVENQDYTYRIDLLRQTNAKVKFLSCEPLLSALPNLDLQDINWVIVGGESGAGARPIKAEWVLDIRDQCQADQVPFFFKQWGGVQKSKNGRLLEGRIWEEMPK